jgi:hypothetical protein
MKKYSNGVLVEMTSSEITERDNLISIHNTLDIVLANLRAKRNNLLAKTDWTSGSDVTMSAEMREYRQKLRDAPSGLDTVEKVQAYEFPTEVLK